MFLPYRHTVGLFYLLKVEKILNDLNIEHFITAGALMGAVRQGAFAGRPNDLDIGLHTVQFHLTLRSGMAASKFHLFAMNYNVLQVCDGTASLLHTLSKSTPDTISYELQ